MTVRSARTAVTGSVHTGFHVADLDRSLDFYVGLLGLELRSRQVTDAPYIGELVGYPGVELHAAFVGIPNSEHWLELLEYRKVGREVVDPANANPGTAHICLTVENLPALHRRLGDAGVEFVSAPVMPTVGINEGRLALYMKDPDGIRVELLQLERIDDRRPQSDNQEVT
jgi:catechol 2,3-dioxygenase-like lactoylglutathione lyase family enzyme